MASIIFVYPLFFFGLVWFFLARIITFLASGNRPGVCEGCAMGVRGCARVCEGVRGVCEGVRGCARGLGPHASALIFPPYFNRGLLEFNNQTPINNNPDPQNNMGVFVGSTTFSK